MNNEQRDIIFGKLSDGRMIALDSQTKKPLIIDGDFVTAAKYYNQAGRPVSTWTNEDKSDFISRYGGGDYLALKRESRNNEFYDSDNVKSWTTKQKSDFIEEHGVEAFTAKCRLKK